MAKSIFTCYQLLEEIFFRSNPYEILIPA